MNASSELLAILVCPACKASLEADPAKNFLNCSKCHRSYPIRDDIPVLLVDEATERQS